MGTNKTLEAALWYVEHGYSIIPITPGQKKPPAGFKVEPFRKRIATPEEVNAWFKEEPNYNIAIVTGELSGICVVDFDSHKPDFDPAIAYDFFAEHDKTPTATTPRGGEHLYYKYPMNERLTINTAALPGIDFRGEGGYILVPPSANGTGNPYAWINNKSLKDIPLLELPNAYINILKHHRGGKGIGGIGGIESTTYSSSSSIYNINKNNIYTERGISSPGMSVLFSEGQRNDHIFHTAHSMLKGGSPRDVAWETVKFIGLNCVPPVDEKELVTTFESAFQRSLRREKSVIDEVRDFVCSSDGLISSSNVLKVLQMSSKQDRKTVNNCLHKLVQEGLLVKEGKTSGVFRTIDREEELIDWKNADITPLDVTFPLYIEKKVKIHRSNVVVIAGESNAGKTAFCLRTALMNKDKFKINYLSSEMNDGTELRIRLDKFNEPMSSWEGIKFQFRTDNFPDKIDPEGFNIIDYLDEGSDAEAYKMGMRIRQIADKLKGGIAIIAIQKPEGRDLGFGGAGTLNRARLYLSISPGTLLIKKGKIWADPFANPNGHHCHFTLAAGCKFEFNPNPPHEFGVGWHLA
ncbi:MAG TPA: bifunctional DNA primase/polymerase [Smithellaceae bacterium]|nr:bifunctional DNA primase/polymerase [Smithellaceae bacterium]